MKRFLIPTLTFVSALMVSACGVAQQAAPTVNPVDLQVTAIVAASTIMAETQAAIPTATSLLQTVAPTNTSAVTLAPLPTFGEVFTATPGGVPAASPTVEDPCVNTPLPNTLEGKPIQIRVKNPTDVTVMLTVNLLPGYTQNVCGYRSYAIPAGQTLSISDLVEGCYSLWAWNPDPKDYFMVTNGTSCLINSKSWAFDIVPNSGITLRE